MKTFRAKFEENYYAVAVPADNKKGFVIKYAYVGPWYKWRVTSAELRREKVILSVLWAVSLVLYCLGGMVPTGVNNTALVTVPGLGAAVPLVFETLGLVKFLLVRERVTKLDWDQINSFLRLCPLFRGLLLLAACGCCALLIATRGFSWAWLSTAVEFLSSGALALSIHSRYRRLPFTSEKNETIKHINDGELDDGWNAEFL